MIVCSPPETICVCALASLISRGERNVGLVRIRYENNKLFYKKKMDLITLIANDVTV